MVAGDSMGYQPAQWMKRSPGVTSAVGRVVDPFGASPQSGLKRRLVLAQIMKQASSVAKLAVSEWCGKPRRAIRRVQ
jgi:adenine C2-methylase RlmN of 23S rRNA A2503 and tRNA A37